MPIKGGGFWDTGVAVALMPGTSYAQARADKSADLQYTMALADVYAKKLQQKQEAETNIRSKFAAMKSLGIEKPDQDRINLLVDDLRSQLSKKIMDKYDGDVAKYMKYEGQSDVDEYTSTLLNNPVLQTALTNKYNFGMYAADVKDGKDYSRTVNYKLNDGTEKKDVPFAEALSDYYTYKTASLPYNGSFEKPKGAMEYFGANYNPDPNYRYGVRDAKGAYGPVNVSPHEYYDYLTNNKENPLSGKDALELVKQEWPSMEGALKWKTDNLQEYLQKMQQYGLDVAKFKDSSSRGWATYNLNKNHIKWMEQFKDAEAAAAKKGQSGPNASDIYYSTMWSGVKSSPFAVGPSGGWNTKAAAIAGITIDKKDGKQVISGDVSKVVSTEDPNIEVDLSDVPHTLVSVDENNKYQDPATKRVYLRAKVEMIDDDLEKKDMLTDGWFSDKPKGFSSKQEPNTGILFGKGNTRLSSNKKRIVDVLIPIPDSAQAKYMFDANVSDPTKKDDATLDNNIRTDIGDFMQTFTTEDSQ